MRRYLRFPILIIALLAMVATGAAAQNYSWVPGPTNVCPIRPGSIEHANSQPADTEILLDRVTVTKIRARVTPAYFVVSDYAACNGNKIVVEYCPSADLHLGQIVEVAGKIAIVNGQHRIVDTTVKGYLKDGKMLYGEAGVPSKPIDDRLVYPSMSADLSGTGCGGDAATPTATDEAQPVFHDTIATAKASVDGAYVWLYNKKIVETGNDAHGFYVIIAADGSNDTLKVYTANTASTADRAWRVQGLMGTYDGQRTLSTNSGPDVDWWISEPRFETYDSGNISWAKAQPDGERIYLPGKIVTARLPDCFYISEPGGYSGIRVQSTRDVTVGRAVNLIATTTTIGAEKSLILVKMDSTAQAATQPKPVGMVGRTLGGASIGVNNSGSTNGQVGVYNGYGYNTIGMLVRVWGKVTEISDDNHNYWIDDGSGLTYSDGAKTHNGVMISLGVDGHWLSIGELKVADYVAVNGIASCTVVDEVVHRSVRQVGEFGIRVLPWWLRNEINPVNGLNKGSD